MLPEAVECTPLPEATGGLLITILVAVGGSLQLEMLLHQLGIPIGSIIVPFYGLYLI